MQSEQINELATALAKAQGQIKNPAKNKTVTVTTKMGSKYEFAYADLSAILDAVRKPLSDNGLGYVQYVADLDGKFRLVTMLVHGSGQWISAANPLFLGDGSPNSQNFGSAVTFMKRYALAAMLGVAADSDDDANAADGNDAQTSDRAAKKATAAYPDKSEKITMQQADHIRTLLELKKVDPAKFLHRALLPKDALVDDLPAFRYDAACKWLETQ